MSGYEPGLSETANDVFDGMPVGCTTSPRRK
jgi:hypothetical protein